MEELKKNIIKRAKAANSSVEEFLALDKCSLAILERLTKVQKDRNLAIIVRNLEDFYYTNKYKEKIKLNEEIIFTMINLIEKYNELGERYSDIITSQTLSANQKVEGLKKMIKAKKDFQVEIISYIYCFNMPYQDIISDIILTCSYKFQTYYIYDIVTFMKYDEEAKEYASSIIEIAKIIAKEKDDDKACSIKEISKNKNLLQNGWAIFAVELLRKCKNYDQLCCVERILKDIGGQINKDQMPYAIEVCKYFLKTTDEDKLNSLYRYLTYSLKQNLLVEEEKVNLIINARNKFNSDAIGNTLTYGPLIDANLDVVASEILNDSRKEYNAKYAKSLVNVGSVSGLSGAMIVNESETKYKAEQVHSIISLYANTDEIDESLEFAALINSVHTKVEIDLIYLLGHNGYLNELGIALPIARVIANATDCEEDIEKIRECLKNEENIVKAIKGFIYLIKCIDLNDRQKTENIINRVLLQTQNKPIHFDFIEEKAPTLNNVKLPTPIRTLTDKSNKKIHK